MSEGVVPSEVWSRLEPGVPVLPEVPVFPASAVAEAMHTTAVIFFAPGAGPPFTAVRGPGLPLLGERFMHNEVVTQSHNGQSVSLNAGRRGDTTGNTVFSIVCARTFFEPPVSAFRSSHLSPHDLGGPPPSD